MVFAENVKQTFFFLYLLTKTGQRWKLDGENVGTTWNTSFYVLPDLTYGFHCNAGYNASPSPKDSHSPAGLRNDVMNMHGIGWETLQAIEMSRSGPHRHLYGVIMNEVK